MSIYQSYMPRQKFTFFWARKAIAIVDSLADRHNLILGSVTVIGCRGTGTTYRSDDAKHEQRHDHRNGWRYANLENLLLTVGSKTVLF